MSENIFRDELALFKPYIPGKSIEEVKKEFGISEIVKLASNENPLGPSPKALEAINKELERVHIYPDPSAEALKNELAASLGVDSRQIVAGNGGEQILQLIAQTFINAGDEAVMADPSFDLYASTVSFLGGVAVKIPLKNFKHDFEQFVSKVTNRTKIIYVCSPNNPTGNIMTLQDLEFLIEKIPEQVVLVLDEAYYDYAKVNPDYPRSMEILKKRANTIILRTFSKVAGIAGVRVGYAVTSLKIAEQINKIKPTFCLNRLAQAAAIGALSDKEHIERTVRLNYEALEMMEKSFDDMGLEYIKSNANFIFVNLRKDSRIMFQKLLEQGIIIRPGFNWKWDNWIRVSTGTLPQTQKFMEAVKDLLSC